MVTEKSETMKVTKSIKLIYVKGFKRVTLVRNTNNKPTFDFPVVGISHTEATSFNSSRVQLAILPISKFPSFIFLCRRTGSP